MEVSGVEVYGGVILNPEVVYLDPVPHDSCVCKSGIVNGLILSLPYLCRQDWTLIITNGSRVPGVLTFKPVWSSI